VVRGWQLSLGILAHFVFLFSLPIFLRISVGLAWELHGEILWVGRMIGRCNTPCFCLVSYSANDLLNQVTNHLWSTLGQTLAQNPSYPFDFPCLPRTFGAFSKIHLNTSNSQWESCAICRGTQLSCWMALRIWSARWWKIRVNAWFRCSLEPRKSWSSTVVHAKLVDQNTLEPL
jgi:hypothetical protein